MTPDFDEVRRSMDARPTEELVSILRNRDEEEWLPEVFDIVASVLESRGVSAREVLELGPEGVDIVEGQNLVTIGRFFSAIEAHAHRIALEQAGLHAWVHDESLSATYGMGVGARLQVRAEDEEAARVVLEAEPAPAFSMPPELAEPPCPKCGSSAVSQEAAVVDSSVDPSRRQWQYTCESCDHVWTA